MLNVRSGYITYPDETIRGSGLRHFPADTHLIAWLEAKGYAYDVITDEELDREGLDLIKPYRVVMTGSHPEYHTGAMLDALPSLSRRRRATDVPRRQRLLLEGRAPQGAAGGDRDPPRRGRHPRLGGGGRRILQRLRWRIWRALAAQRPAAAEPRRRRLHGAGQFRRLATTG